MGMLLLLLLQLLLLWAQLLQAVSAKAARHAFSTNDC
jgi:hypothetical protein